MNEIAQKGSLFPKEIGISIVGLTAYWPLMRRSSYQVVFVDTSFFLAFAIIAGFVALFALIVYEYLSSHQRVVEVATIITSFAATILAALGILGLIDLAGSWLWLLGAFFYGVSFVFLTIEWGWHLIRYDMRIRCLVALGAFSAAILLGLVATFQSAISALLITLLPLTSACMILFLPNPLQERSTNESDRTKPQPLMYVLVLFLLAGSTIRGLYYTNQAIIPFGNMIAMDALTLLFCALLCLVIASSKKRNQQRRLFLQAWMMISVLIFVGLVLAMMFGQEERQWGDELTLISRMLLSVLLWLVLASDAQDRRQLAFAMNIWVLIEMTSSLLAYYLMPELAAYLPSPIDASLAGSALTLVLFTVLIIASFFFLQRVIADLDRATIEVVDVTHKQSCEQLADAYGLSSRELEIMILYSQGSSSRSIAEKLYISPETVRTHVKNMYDKMGIHKKQELIDRIQDQSHTF